MAIPSEPASRAETYLASIAGQNVSLPAEPSSRMEQYLEAINEGKVEANPTLEGGETALTGLKVGGTKYSVPQDGSTHLYEHVIKIREVSTYQITLKIISTDSTPFTKATLTTFLYDKDLTSSDRCYPASGSYIVDSAIPICGLYALSSSISDLYLVAYSIDGALSCSLEYGTLTTTVIQIL